MPRRVGQLPLYAGRKWAAGSRWQGSDYSDLEDTPLFAFGHGLSYTDFEYGELTVETSGRADAPITISLDVANTGDSAGDEVVQLYVQDLVASTTRPLQQLAGFLRARFEPGQTRRVTFTLDPSQLALYDRAMRLVVEPGEFLVRVGASSEDIRCEARFRLEGEPREIPFPSPIPTRRIGRISSSMSALTCEFSAWKAREASSASDARSPARWSHVARTRL